MGYIMEFDEPADVIDDEAMPLFYKHGHKKHKKLDKKKYKNINKIKKKSKKVNRHG